ncbi:MAG: HAMP domain-containing histidine kinase [Rickettsiaceae bacterium]|nr:HAMP domain-containing histidine kinase [Rickettsiaceae bacterium]MDP4833013.1 HAMP domain-containing histidine kinase [Rickettsiaceae bacterium]MDP5020634.1 HAMP domain-containing histidine kinase [Rickettsiaceae bacterium]MDP5083021.1 HAMP domain-containing histidine kinase [Rickettsiaceae bacterium]
MYESESKATIDQIEKKVAMQMITFSIIIIILIITLVSFIRIYSNKEERILKDMQTEAILLETVITDHLNYSRYFVNMIGRNIQINPHDLNYIHHILKDHFTSQDFNMLFGWKKFSWVDNNFFEIVTSTQGILESPRYKTFIQETLGNKLINSTDWKNKISFYTSSKINNEYSLKIIDNVADSKSNKYIGSVVLSYDINTMIRSLNLRKTNKSINFVILNPKLEVVAQSKPYIENLINNNEELDTNLTNVLKTLNTNANNTRNLSYLDMVNGINYFITPLKGLPFIIIVNIDNKIIKQDIIDNVAKTFIEVCIFAVLCLAIIISIYKRETFLRTKAEKATAVANNATKAKTDFLAFTAHEIRSPLGFIVTGSEIMTKELMGKLPSKYKEYATGIHNNSQLILDFITDILDENQILEGKFKIINTLNNITDIINEAINNSLTRYNSRNIKVLSNVDNNLPLLICDKRRLIQIMSNLISNSIKYSKDNTTIRITAEYVKKNLIIKIIDQGIGMSEEELPIALSAYGTVHGSDYNKTGSYGLGLPIVKMLLDAHDAKIIIDSIKGEGTTITLLFPRYKLIYNNN